MSLRDKRKTEAHPLEIKLPKMHIQETKITKIYVQQIGDTLKKIIFRLTFKKLKEIHSLEMKYHI